MQSGRGKLKKWVLEFETKDPSINPLMGWETSTDTLEEVVLKFSTKEQAVEYAKKNNISYKVIEPKKKEFVIKSCLLYTSPSPRDQRGSRMPSSA